MKFSIKDDSKKMNHQVLLRLCLAMVSCSIAIWSVGYSAMVQSDAANVKLDIGNNGEQITVKEGTIIEIVLEGNPTTGYSWFIQNLETKYVVLISEKTSPKHSPSEYPHRVGGSTHFIWHFKTITKGNTEIKLNYYRSWEGISSAVEHFKIKVTII
ncbi:proteinase inhibitor I42, chagasin [Candidatus Magnetobacterium bavaricum]|uniref:Proteinase inhibitor I42, chagasin n=1 Tax=Candidatus Magnetobacterium bavaricum TaxID=29290 RepID=A0A0F3GS20_9BACT|nr:proteinase inhibitor I42, chagasin [Candidatus Magnetobacterium bavaricum]